MDPLIRPRLRLSRPSPSPRVHDGDATPQASARLLHDDESDGAPTPRVHPRPIVEQAPHSLPEHAETPAARLRALLAREPRSPRASTTPPPAPSSEADSARFGSSSSSVARDSLRDIFSRALREPGDTPQKDRPRRNSFDGSSMEITPVVGRNRGQRRATRRSLSDEEAEKPKSNRRADPSLRLSTALTFDALRARLASSRSQLMNQNLPEALYDPSTSDSDAQQRPQPSTSTHVNAHVNSLTPLPSFQMSSPLGFQSNLLEQDSEMQRAMGDVLNSENEASTSAQNAPQSAAAPSDSRPSPSIRESRSGTRPEQRHSSYGLDSLTSSGRKDREDHQQEEHNHQCERDWNRRRVLSSTPETQRRHSQEFHRRRSLEFRSPSYAKSLTHESATPQSSAVRPVHKPLERRSSLASLRSFDDDRSSRPSSIGSQSDYRDRISELEREKNYEREREWNKRHPPPRPSSSLSTSSNHSFTHSHSHPPRSPSAIPYLTPTHASLQRKSSRTSLRSESPSSLASSHDSLKELEEEEKKEKIHERERNWNSPRPHWSASKSPSTHLKIRNKDDHLLRASSSLPHLKDSNGHGDASRASTKLRSSLSRVDDSSVRSQHQSGDHLDSDLEASAAGTAQSAQLKDFSPGKASGVASKFGWNFARSPLPPLEFDDTADHQTTSLPAPGSRPSSRASGAVTSSHIPVRLGMKNLSGVGHAPSDMSLTNVVGDESSFQQDSQNRPGDVVEPDNQGEGPQATNSWNREDVALGSEEEFIIDPPQTTTPKSYPPKLIPEETETDTETEVLASPSRHGSPQLEASTSIPNETPRQMNNPPRAQTPNLSPEAPPVAATPPGTPPPASPRAKLPTSEVSSSFALVTPPRGTSFGGSILDFRTPSPPHDLPDLPGPPLSSDDDALGGSPTKDRRVDANPNFTSTKTPKPPGAWAATPLPPKVNHRSTSPATLFPFPLESTPPTSTSTPLPRASSLPPTHADTTTDGLREDQDITPITTLSRARSLPLRTPVLPGGWVATPGQSALVSNGPDQSHFGSIGRRKGLLKVRFDVTESETSATEGHPNSPLTAIRLTNPELPLPKLTTHSANGGGGEVAENEAPLQSQPSTRTVPHRPATPERPTTPISRENVLSPRSPRKSPSVRVVDAYGRERVDEEGTLNPLIDLLNGHADVEKMTSSPPTPRRSLVRIVDAMGREVDDTVEMPDALKGGANRSFEADVSLVSDDTSIGHAEALARMRKTLKDLAESLSEADRSEDLELNSSHLEQLEEVSQAARLARNQLAHNLHLETEKEQDLHHDNKSSAAAHGLLPAAKKSPWNTVIIYCGIIIQILFVFAMWRYAHTEARRLFYTTYYDPLYPEFTPIQGDSCFSGTLSTSRSWTMLDSYETIRREGLRSIRKEMLRTMRHIGDRAWERWGENVHFEKPT